MDYVVATIDFDSSTNPSYDKLDIVLQQHGLYAPQPKAWKNFPRNTYFGNTPEGIPLKAFGKTVVAAVKGAGLKPMALLLAKTMESLVVPITDD